MSLLNHIPKTKKPDNKPASGSFFFQPKLTINEPNDIYEQEADAVADKVMRMPAAGTNQAFFRQKPAPVSAIQKCACEEEEKLQRKEEGQAEEVHLKTGDDNSAGMTATPAVHDAINSSGQTLDGGTKNFMESRFGYDFSDVQIHNDSLAHRSSTDINALAYTHGNHIVFGEGQYRPDSDSGKQLLAHELTHVVQQKNGLKQISRAVYDVGTSPNAVRINIDYGQVVYYLIHEWGRGVGETYTRYTGLPAVDTAAAVSALSSSQQQWVLFAIDLLSDNQTGSLDKKEAVNRLIDHAPQAIARPLGADFKTNSFENEVLRVSGWFEKALTSSLKSPNSAEQSALNKRYNPRSPGAGSTGSGCPSSRPKGSDLDEPVLRAGLFAFGKKYLAGQEQLLPAAVNVQNISGINPVADMIQQEALSLFAPYIGNSGTRPFLQTWKYSSNLIATTSPGAIPVRAQRDLLENRLQDATTTFENAHYDSRCDEPAFTAIVDALMLEPNVQNQLSKIISWKSFTESDNSKATTRINLQYNSATTNECEARWQTVKTLCHELLHAYVSQDFTDMSKGRKLIAEGFPDVLGNQLYSEIFKKATGSKAYRSKFEAGLSPHACDNVDIDFPGTKYKDAKQADEILTIVGKDRFRAAYFLGQNTLAGLQPKLKSGSQNSSLEQEADQVAEHIVSKKHPAVSLIQRQPRPPSPHDQALVARAKKRLAIIEPQIDLMEQNQLDIQVERRDILQQRERLDIESFEADLAAVIQNDPLLRQHIEDDFLSKLNRKPVDFIITNTDVVITVNFQVLFEDPAMITRFKELQASFKKGLDIVWNHTMSGNVFGGRKLSVVPTFTLMNAKTPRDHNTWLIFIQKTDSSPITYAGCNSPATGGVPTSITDVTCDGGTIFVPPLHISKPGVLGHELLHLFGLVDRNFSEMPVVAPGTPPVVINHSLRTTPGRPDPLGADDGTILREDLGFLFDRFGVYDKEERRSTLGLSSLALEAMRLREIIRLGYDPNSLLPKPPKDFTDRMIRDAENLD